MLDPQLQPPSGDPPGGADSLGANQPGADVVGASALNTPVAISATPPTDWSTGTTAKLSSLVTVSDADGDPIGLYMKVVSGGSLIADGQTYAAETPVLIRAAGSAHINDYGFPVITGATLAEAIAKVSVRADAGASAAVLAFNASDTHQLTYGGGRSTSYALLGGAVDTPARITTRTPTSWSAGATQSLTDLVSVSDSDGDPIGLYMKVASGGSLIADGQTYAAGTAILIRASGTTGITDYGMPVITGATLAEAMAKVKVVADATASSAVIAYNASDTHQLTYAGAQSTSYALKSDEPAQITTTPPSNWTVGTAQALSSLVSVSDAEGDPIGLYMKVVSGATLTADGQTYAAGTAILIRASGSAGITDYGMPVITGATLAEAMAKVKVVADASGSSAVLAFNASDSHRLTYGGAQSTSYSLQSKQSVDTTAPTLSSASPSNNATNIAVGANIVLTFSETVVAGSGNLTLSDKTNGTSRTIAVTDTSQVSFSGGVMTINPSADLVAGDQMEVSFGAGVVKDAAGNAFAGLSSGALRFTARSGAGTDVASLMTNSTVKADLKADLTDGALDYNEMLKLLTDVEAGGVASDEFTDLTTLMTHWNDGISMSSYVHDISNKLINGDKANASWTGGAMTSTALGDLRAGSTATQMDELIKKWFLGADLPSPIGANDVQFSYAVNDNSLFGADGQPSVDDINQGQLGDCYLLSSMADIALCEPSAITSMFVDNGNKTYGVRFYLNGRESWVTVDDHYVVTSRGAAAFNESTDNWSNLVEKAYVQLNESNYNSYHSGTAFNIIEGGNADPLKEITNKNFDYYGLSSESLQTWNGHKNTIVSAIANHQEVWLASETNTTISGEQALVASHAYSVTGYDSATGDFIVRNPWGTSPNQDYLTTFEVGMADLYKANDYIAVARASVGAAAAPALADTVGALALVLNRDAGLAAGGLGLAGA